MWFISYPPILKTPLNRIGIRKCHTLLYTFPDMYYSGIYQKLSLIVGKEYQASIQTGYMTSIGNLYFNTYTPDGDSYILTSTSSTVFPSGTVGYLGILTATFTAQSPNDIILIYGTTEETSAQSFLIQNISIKEKQEYLTPIYGTDMFDIAHKVLRVSANQDINDET